MSRRRKSDAPVFAGSTPITRPASVDESLLHGVAAPLADDRLSAQTVRRMSPALTNSILRGASCGDPVDLHDLYNTMARTWPRLAKNLQTIRQAAIRAPWAVTPWADKDGNVPQEALDRKATVEAALFNMQPRAGYLEGDFDDFVGNAAENVCRGTGVHELLWHRYDPGDGEINAIRAVRLTHPYYYAWPLTGSSGAFQPTPAGTTADRHTEDRLLFRPGGRHAAARSLTEWPAHQFAVQLAPAWNDHPAMSGILGVLSMWWIGANYGPQWLFTFAENFGIPFMWATYPAGDTASRDAVYTMLKSLAGRKYGAFPTGSMINLLETAKSAGTLPQVLLVEHADKVCDITLLGQPLTSDNGEVGSQALGKVHADVKHDVLYGVCSQVAKPINRQIVPAILMLNYGDTKFAPKVEHGLVEPEDEEAKARTDGQHMQNGARISVAYYHKRHRIPIPAEGEEIMQPQHRNPDVAGTSSPPSEEKDKDAGARATAAAADPETAAVLRALLDSEADTLTDVFHTTLNAAVKKGHELAADEMREAASQT